MCKRVTVLTLCVCVSEASTVLEHRFYDNVNIAADCLLRFQDFQLTELSDVVSFMVFSFIFHGSGHFSEPLTNTSHPMATLHHLSSVCTHTRQIRYGAHHIPRGVS